MRTPEAEVCIIARCLYPYDTRLRQQARTLARAGIQVDVICLLGDKQPRLEQSGLIAVHRVAKARPKESFLSYIFVSAYFACAAFCRLLQLQLQRPHQVLVIHTLPECLVFTGIAHKLIGKPVVLDLRDLSVELVESHGDCNTSNILTPLVRFMEKRSCRFADKLITASPGFRDRLIKRGTPPDKITLLYNSADTQVFTYQDQRKFPKITERARLIYHGTVSERFAVSTAIEAVALLQNRIPGSELHIYGSNYDSGYKKTLYERIRQLGIGDYVFLHGVRKHEELNEIFRECDIGVIPYPSNDFMNLALSTKAFEYAASGVPMVASRLSSLELVFGTESVLFAEPSDTRDLANKIAMICLDPELRSALVANARERHSEISGDVMSKCYLDLISGLMTTD